jgi:hypothetical protein
MKVTDVDNIANIITLTGCAPTTALPKLFLHRALLNVFAQLLNTMAPIYGS